MYRLLENCSVNMKKNAIHFYSQLQECDEETKKQLEYILDQLRCSDSSESSSISDDDEIVEEEIYLEEEIDQEDPVIARRDELSGLMLLEKFYTSSASVEQVEVVGAGTVDPDDRPIRPQTGSVLRLEFGNNNHKHSAGNTNLSRRRTRSPTAARRRRSSDRGARPRWRKTRRTSRNRSRAWRER